MPASTARSWSTIPTRRRTAHRGRGRARRRRPCRRRRRTRGGCARRPGSSPTVPAMRPPQRRRAPAVPGRQDRGRERGGAGVPGRERRRRAACAPGAADRPATVGRGRRNSRLSPWLTIRLSTPRASGERRDLVGPAVARQPARDVDEVPDQAEVAEVATRPGRWHRRTGARVVARARCRPTGRSGRPSGRASGAQAGWAAVAERQLAPGRPTRGRHVPAVARRRLAVASGASTAAGAGSPPKLGHQRWKLQTCAQRARAGPEVAGAAGPLDGLPHGRGAGGDEPHRLLGRRGLDRLAAAQVHQPDRRPGGGRTPARTGTSRSARRPGCVCSQLSDGARPVL